MYPLLQLVLLDINFVNLTLILLLLPHPLSSILCVHEHLLLSK